MLVSIKVVQNKWSVSLRLDLFSLVFNVLGFKDSSDIWESQTHMSKRSKKIQEIHYAIPKKETVFFFNLQYQVRTNIAECPLGFFSFCFLRPLKTPCEVQQLETLVVPCVLVRTWFCNLVNSAPVPISTYNLSQATNEYFPSNVSWVNFKSLENKKDTKV